jgi:hypothetical protein
MEPIPVGLSEPSRIVNTFFAPGKTFEDIRHNTSWWAPWLLMSIIGLASHFMVVKKVDFDQVTRTMMAQSPQFQQQPAEQQERTIAFTAAFIKYGGYFVPVFAILGALLVGLIMMATFNFGLQAEVSFGQSLAIMMYAWLPSILWSILAVVSLMVGNPDNFHIQNPVATNPAYFLDPATTSKFLYPLAMSLDVISLWIVALMGIGFAKAAKKKISIGTGITVVASWYFLYKLLGAAWAGLHG